MDEIDRRNREIDSLMFRQIARPPQPIDFSSFNYSLPKLESSVKNLRYSDDHVKFVEEKLQVTREGECEEKINAMDTEQFIRFYKEVTEEWGARKIKYPEKKRRKVAY